MSDMQAEVERIYAQFVANQAYRQFRELSDRMDRWTAANAGLGYSSETAWFTEIAETFAPTDLVAAVRPVVDLCASMLAIDTPRLVWFLPETPAEQAYRLEHGPHDLDQFCQVANLSGLADRDGGVIWVRADLSPRRAMRTAAHECRHLAQQPHDGPDGYIANELDAREFASQFARAYDLN